MCKYTRNVEEDFRILSEESKEKMKRIICRELCSGLCRDEYLDQSSKANPVLAGGVKAGKMKVVTNNKAVAVEVLSAQNLFTGIDEIAIQSIGSPKHCLNNYDALVTVKGMTFKLYRDLNFQNINIWNIINSDLNAIEFVDFNTED